MGKGANFKEIIHLRFGHRRMPQGFMVRVLAFGGTISFRIVDKNRHRRVRRWQTINSAINIRMVTLLN